MRGEATKEERTGFAYSFLKMLEEEGYDEREVVTTLLLAITIFWEKQKMSLVLYDKMIATVRRRIKDTLESDS